MARQRLESLRTETTLSFENVGDAICGNYIGNYTAETKFGPALVHVFATPSGKSGAWGCYELDKELARIEKQSPGAMTWVTYKGKTQIGKKTLKTFSIDWDPEDTVEGVPATPDTNQAS